MKWTCIVAIGFLGLSFLAQEQKPEAPSSDQMAAAEGLMGLEMTAEERALMREDLGEHLADYQKNRKLSIDNGTPPALYFQPLPPGFKIQTQGPAPVWSDPGTVTRPDRLEDLAFYSLGQLGYLIRTKAVSSTELTKMVLARLKEHGPKLQCVVTLTEELALKQAARADEEIAQGRYRGPLHGIPYGAKDLFAVAGYKTTWGAKPYQYQVLDDTATVVQKLEQAGAVLVAKLTLGALAWGDVWFNGRTRNPWNTEQGSSGSSAGSASATAAGLVPFSLGTETWGSIVSPSTRCGVTGLRPTFGRVSRGGAMALSWSMDKVGPICRSVEDCALVFDAIRGGDPRDLSAVDAAFSYQAEVNWGALKIGYLKSAFEVERPGKDLDLISLEVLRKLGANLVPIELPKTDVSSLAFILSAEAAAAFDELTRHHSDDQLVRQIKNAWPNVFRAARFIPAVEYLQANRIRTMVMAEMEALMATIDLYVAPSFGGNSLLLTNLTGHPAVVVPNGFSGDPKTPKSITFTGRLMDEATILAVAKAYQDATYFHKNIPPGFK